MIQSNNINPFSPELDHPIGSRVMIWKQDPSVTEVYDMRKIFIPLSVLEGPRDEMVEVKGLKTAVKPDAAGDFLKLRDSEAMDAVHTYAVVRQTILMYERALAEGDKSYKLRWFWNHKGGKKPLQIFPYGLPNQMDAHYDPSTGSLRFGHFLPRSGASKGRVYACRSLDVVAHETGHAVLDGMKPLWSAPRGHPENGALHESFGDLTAIFLVLSQLDLVEAVVAQTRANLRDKSFLSQLAEEFGLHAGFRTDGLRNAINDLKVSEAGEEVHDLSTVFTGAVYDILAAIYSISRKPQFRDDAHVLLETGVYLRGVVIRAFLAAPDRNAVFTDVARCMLDEVKKDRPEYVDIFQRSFEKREIGVTASRRAMARSGLVEGGGKAEHSELQDRSKCCSSMRRRAEEV